MILEHLLERESTLWAIEQTNFILLNESVNVIQGSICIYFDLL